MEFIHTILADGLTSSQAAEYRRGLRNKGFKKVDQEYGRGKQSTMWHKGRTSIEVGAPNVIVHEKGRRIVTVIPKKDLRYKVIQINVKDNKKDGVVSRWQRKCDRCGKIVKFNEKMKKAAKKMMRGDWTAKLYFEKDGTPKTCDNCFFE